MLDVAHAQKSYGSKTAVRDVQFTVENGAAFGLLGPNGAGKTTTMRMILGIIAPDGGEITWNGKRIDDDVRRRFGYLPEERGLYPTVKVKKHIRYFGALHGLREPALTKQTDWWIERLDLGAYADVACGGLSKGNQQKVQMACAAVHSPELVILDEPFSGLDPVNAENLSRALSELKAGGTTVILSSHQLWQLESLCDIFCIIAHGENRALGTLQSLGASWPTRIVRVTPATPGVCETLLRLPNARMRTRAKDVAEVEVRADTEFSALLRALVQIEEIVGFQVLEPSLGDIYLKAIEGTAR
jgi:ABC-2 type transport system ATP-binding protein